jgi:hypothetical protein
MTSSDAKFGKKLEIFFCRWQVTRFSLSMIPRAYTVGNFKAIGAHQTIQIRPITLLFGKNSAGKSSIIQSLLLCRYAAETGSFDFSSTRHWGQSVDLGGFRNFVHRHNTSAEMTFGFEFERTHLEKNSTAADSQVARKILAQAVDATAPEWSFCFFNLISTLSISVKVGLPNNPGKPPHHKGPFVQSLSVEVDHCPLVALERDSRGELARNSLSMENLPATIALATVALRYLENTSAEDSESQPTGPDMSKAVEALGLNTEVTPASVIKRVEDAYHVLLELASLEDTKKESEREIQDLIALLGQSEQLGAFLWVIESRMDEIIRNLTVTGNGLMLELHPRHRLPMIRSEPAPDTGTKATVQVEALENPVSFFVDGDTDGDQVRGLANALRLDLELIIEAALASVQHWLRSSEYIGPFRSIPGRFFEITSSVGAATEDAGYQALKSIAEKPELLREIADILRDTLETPYRLETRKIAPRLDHDRLSEAVKRCVEIHGSKISPGELREKLGDILREATEGETKQGLYLVDTRNETAVDFCDVGFGIGQVLPLVFEMVSAHSGIVCIEQPEVHIHPKMQSDLADVFIREKGANAAQKLFILETHSEHMILRLLRRVRETARGKVKTGLAPIFPHEISVAWVEAGKWGSVITTLAVDKRGRFTTPWPEGFFEERLDEMFD